MKKLLLISVVIAGLFTACKKTDFDTTITGEALGPFRITGPATGTSLVLNSATPNEKVEITWTAAKPGVSKQPTYKWIAAKKVGGSLDQPLIEMPSDASGTGTKLTLTYKQLDSLLNAKGIAANTATDLIWSVVSDNGTTVKRADDTFTINLKRMGDGVSPFAIYGPLSSTTNLEINPTSTADSVKFVWQKATPGVAANPVNYKVVFTAEGSTTPLFTVSSRNNGADTTVSLSWKQISDSLSAHGYTDFSQIAKLSWNVVGTSGTFSMPSMYTNQLYIVRLVRMYLVGSINGWNINTPFEMVADKANGRLGKVFYTYIKLNAGDEFKFAKTPGDWGSAYGNKGASGTGFSTGYNEGGNFSVSTPGVYRLTIDLGNNMAYVQQKEVGLVGSMQGWDPSAPIKGGLIARNKFLILTNMGASDIFKFHDGPEWNNSAPDKARWWGKGSAPGLLDADGNGDNLTAEPGAGIVRAIWDATNPQQVKYELSKGQLRVVGAAPEFGSWNPDNALNMAYQGNGIWKVTVTITSASEFKFVSSQGWSFNYGGTGGSGNSGNLVPGGDNLNKPAGTYTITVDEYNQTYSIQ